MANDTKPIPAEVLKYFADGYERQDVPPFSNADGTMFVNLGNLFAYALKCQETLRKCKPFIENAPCDEDGGWVPLLEVMECLPEFDVFAESDAKMRALLPDQEGE